MLLGLALGYVIGKIIAVLLGIVVTNANANAYEFVELIPAGTAAFGLFLTLFRYNKEKEDELGA